MTTPASTEALAVRLEEDAAEDAMIHCLPWPHIKRNFVNAAAMIRRLAGEVEELKATMAAFVAHYPVGVNPFLDDVYRKARVLTTPTDGDAA